VSMWVGLDITLVMDSVAIRLRKLAARFTCETND
jgi:hypothetical protein